MKKTFALILVLVPTLLFAAGILPDGGPLATNGTGGSDLQTVFLNVLDVVQTILIMTSTVYLIYAGFTFVVAKGDPTKIKKSRDALMWGLVGAALILCAEVLAYGLGDTVKSVFMAQ